MSRAADCDDTTVLALPGRTAAGIIDIPNAAIGPPRAPRVTAGDETAGIATKSHSVPHMEEKAIVKKVRTYS